MLIFFEVMDKEPSLTWIWCFFLAFGVGGFFLVRRHPAFLAVVLPFVLLFGAALWMELNDPSIGAAIVREAGYGYVVQSYLAMAAGFLLPLTGMAAWFFRKTEPPLS